MRKHMRQSVRLSNKSIVFFALILPVFSFFSCSLEIPKAVQIKGTPEIRFGANLDLSESLSEMMDEFFTANNDDGISFINCTNTQMRTFIIHMNLFSEDINLPIGFDFSQGGLIPHGLDDVYNDSMSVPAMDFDFLEDFSFSPSDTRIYISGSPIVNYLTTELTISGLSSEYSMTGKSYLDDISEFDKLSLPNNGTPISLPFTGDSIAIDYRIFFTEGKTIPSGLDTSLNVLVEIAVMVPMTLIAGSSGASFEFPEMFPAGQDLFGRENPGDENPLNEFVEALSLDIRFNNIPFTGATLMVKSGDINIDSNFTGNSLFMNISEAKMNEINNKYPFAPEFSMRFVPGGKLSIPREFKATEFAFKAKLNYRMELWEESK
ncbi:MAG: hypothetical protein LBG94_09355 [Treponema sp.]|nr:hypothetical protein [Treponema sp.]